MIVEKSVWSAITLICYVLIADFVYSECKNGVLFCQALLSTTVLMIMFQSVDSISEICDLKTSFILFVYFVLFFTLPLFSLLNVLIVPIPL